MSIAGIGTYKGSVTFNFIIVPTKAAITKVKSNGSGSIRIQAKKQEGVSGYQYAWRISGKKWAKSSTNKNVRIASGLKGGKTYQVKVRAYKKIDDKNWYGKWSTTKNVKVRK